MVRKITLTLTVFVVSLVTSHSMAQYSRLKKNVKREHKSAWIQMTPIFSQGTHQFQTPEYNSGEGKLSFEEGQSQSGGILLDLNSHKTGIALQTGVIYQDSQYSENITILSQNRKIESRNEVSSQFINLPFIAKFYPFTLASKWLYLKGGLNIQYLLDSNAKATLTVSDNSTGQTESDSSSGNQAHLRKRYDVQAIVGLGLAIPISKSIGIIVEGNYNHGIIDTYEVEDKSFGTQTVELKSKSLYGVIGLAISL